MITKEQEQVIDSMIDTAMVDARKDLLASVEEEAREKGTSVNNVLLAVALTKIHMEALAAGKDSKAAQKEAIGYLIGELMKNKECENQF